MGEDYSRGGWALKLPAPFKVWLHSERLKKMRKEKDHHIRKCHKKIWQWWRWQRKFPVRFRLFPILFLLPLLSFPSTQHFFLSLLPSASQNNFDFFSVSGGVDVVSWRADLLLHMKQIWRGGERMMLQPTKRRIAHRSVKFASHHITLFSSLLPTTNQKKKSPPSWWAKKSGSKKFAPSSSSTRLPESEIGQKKGEREDDDREEEEELKNNDWVKVLDRRVPKSTMQGRGKKMETLIPDTVTTCHF